jgi:hypothetical protein
MTMTFTGWNIAGAVAGSTVTSALQTNAKGLINAPDDTLSRGDRFTVGPNQSPSFRFEGFATSGNTTGFTAFVGSHTGRYYFTQDPLPPVGSTVVRVGGDVVICFLAGTMVATPSGEVAIEALRAGDTVLTADGAQVPVRWVGRQTISTVFADPLRVNPILVRAGALAENLPSRDLYVSPQHALLVDGILVSAEALVNGTSILRAPAPADSFVYFHVETADHSLILANATPAETFLDHATRRAFDNWQEHPDAGAEAPIQELDLPRARSWRQLPLATRQRLESRAMALFGEAASTAA